jgi:aminopeptidase
MTDIPPQEILERYANLLVNYALGGGAGIKPGDVVGLYIEEDAKPLLLEIGKAVWRAGGHLMTTFTPADHADWNLQKAFFEIASPDQLDFFPAVWEKAWYESIDHFMMVLAPRDLHSLTGVDAEKIYRHDRAFGPVLDYRFDRVRAGELSWTLCVYGTDALAAEAGMTLEEYWEQISFACYLDDPDPVARTRESATLISSTVTWLNGLDIDRLHVEAPDTDLWITVGEHRKWLGGGSVNIPSYEIFTSPDWRGTHGHIRFSEPLYWNGAVLEGVRLRFEDGLVVEATAETGDAEIKAMIGVDEGSARIGEYSLTDGRVSRVTRFMANTLFDENRGGPTGNTHLAVGRAYKGTYTGDENELDEARAAELGFNDSSIHVDIISTSERTVTAVLRDGTERVIYAGGRFLNDD